MIYSPVQAKKLAIQIRDRFSERISTACQGHYMETVFLVPESFLAGLIGVEAGKDRRGEIVETATRYEPHVYRKLRDVRDKRLTSYNHIRHSDIKDASELALKALATSYGTTQIMGWWAIHLNCSVADLRAPEKHLGYAVTLLERSAKKYINLANYKAALRVWNTGKAQGQTHDPHYVENALAVKRAYEELAS